MFVRRWLLFGGLVVVGVLLLILTLSVGMMLGSSGTDTPDSALEEREANVEGTGEIDAARLVGDSGGAMQTRFLPACFAA